VEHRTFEVISGAPGPLPSSIVLYAKGNTPQPANNPRVKTENGSVKSEPDLDVATSSSSSSILFAMWKESTADAPELWRLSLGPSMASFQCLGLKQRLKDLKVAMYTFVVVNNRSVLLGRRRGGNQSCFNTAVEIML
jgi:hypothetical protein